MHLHRVVLDPVRYASAIDQPMPLTVDGSFRDRALLSFGGSRKQIETGSRLRGAYYSRNAKAVQASVMSACVYYVRQFQLK